MQAVIVMASLTAPVLASVMAPELGVPPHVVGYYSALVYAVAASCLALMVMVQRWRGQLDDDRDPRARLPGLRLWGPARLMLAAPLRELAIACFAFAALQFSFSAVFVTVLTEGAKWPLVDA